MPSTGSARRSLLQPQSRYALPVAGAFRLRHGAAHEIDMLDRGRAGERRLPRRDRLVNGAVLLEDPLANTRQVVDHGAVAQDPIRQQPIAGAERMEKDDVVRAFADGIVEFDVDRRFLAGVAASGLFVLGLRFIYS